MCLYVLSVKIRTSLDIDVISVFSTEYGAEDITILDGLAFLSTVWHKTMTKHFD